MVAETGLSSAGPNPAVLNDYLTPTQLAHELGVSLRTVVRWNSRRQGPPQTRVGRRVLYRLASVKAWLAKHERDPDEGEETPRRRRGASNGRRRA
jgi:excisionase family DNA binding protein